MVVIIQNGEEQVFGGHGVRIIPPSPEKYALTVPPPDASGAYPLIRLEGRGGHGASRLHAVMQGGIGLGITLCSKAVTLPLPATDYGRPDCGNCCARLRERAARDLAMARRW